MTEGLRRHFDDYARFHTTPGNKACLCLGIPIIVLASLALLARVPLFTALGQGVTLAELLIVAFLLYNSPAFFRNVVHLAVGQLWLLARAVGRA